MYISFPIFSFGSKLLEKFQYDYYIYYIIDFIEKNSESNYIKTYTTLDLSNINFDLILTKINNNMILKLINLLNLNLKNKGQPQITKITLENSIISTTDHIIEVLKNTYITEINIKNTKEQDTPVVSISFESELSLCGFIRSEPTSNDIWVLNSSAAIKNLKEAGIHDRFSLRGGSMKNKTNINKKTHKNKYNK
jgi:hypothetical protein